MISVMYNLALLIRAVGAYSFARSEVAGRVSMLDSGTGSESENFALLLGGAPCTARDMSKVLDASRRFFGHVPRNWPLFPIAAGEAARVLEDTGARRDGVFFDMWGDVATIRDSAADRSPLVRVDDVGTRDAELWARAMWRGFGSDESAPPEAVRLARAMAGDEVFRLVAVQDAGVTSATGMMTCFDQTAGIYYISTVPEARRRGLAAAVMRGLMERAVSMGARDAVLLATPSGAHFYETVGMRASAEVPIYVEEA